MKRIPVVLLALIFLFVSCSAEPKMCIVIVDDGAGSRTELRIVSGSEFQIEAKTRAGYRITSIQDQNGKSYKVGDKITISTDMILIYSWEVYTPASDFRWDISETQVMATSYIGNSESVKIPEKVNGRPVTAICESCFYGHATLKELIIPDTVDTIMSKAFKGCIGLEKIQLPNSLKKIGSGVFEGCISLKELKLPESIEEIDNTALSGCTGINELRIPDSIVNIGTGVFRGWTEKQTIVFEENVLSNALLQNWNDNCNAKIVWLGNMHCWEFEEDSNSITITNCTDPSSNIVIPSHLKGKPVLVLADRVFINRRDIVSVSFPETLEYIGNECFLRCDNLKSIKLPASLKNVGNNAFKDCIRIESLDTSDAVQLAYIGEGAFYGCKALTEFNIPESVEGVGRFAFGKCSIKSFYIPERLRSIEVCAFNSRNLETITINDRNRDFYVKGNCLISRRDNKIIMATSKAVIPTDPEITTIGNKAFSHIGIVKIDIPENITTIEREAFGYCTELHTISFPKSLMSMDGNPAGYCPKLANITVAEGNPFYHSAGNSLIFTSSQTLVIGCKNTVIPEDSSVKNIGGAAFLGSSEMTGITIPSNITTIGFLAFAKCTGINELVIPCTVSCIGEWTFSNWTSRQTIRIEAGTPVHKWDAKWNYERVQTIGQSEDKIISARIEGLS